MPFLCDLNLLFVTMAIVTLTFHPLTEADDETSTGVETVSDLLNQDPYSLDQTLDHDSPDDGDDVFGHQESLDVDPSVMQQNTLFGPQQAR